MLSVHAFEMRSVRCRTLPEATMHAMHEADSDMTRASAWIAPGGPVDDAGAFRERPPPHNVAGGDDAPLEEKCGVTMLMITSWYGHIDCVNCLLELNADPTLRDASGQTALLIAARRGHAAVVQRLCLASTKVQFWEAMADAEARGHAECVTVMREHAAREQVDVIGSPLTLPYAVATATIQGLTSTMRGWLDAGGHINAQERLHGTTLLACVCMCDQELIGDIDLLIRRGASIDLKDKRGHSPLELSSINGHARITARLGEVRSE